MKIKLKKMTKKSQKQREEIDTQQENDRKRFETEISALMNEKHRLEAEITHKFQTVIDRLTLEKRKMR